MGDYRVTPTGAPARRLPREARRRQLIAAALPLAARQGLTGLSLDDLAVRAGVTRNLLYHYFPRGRRDVVAAVVEEAGRQLTGHPPTEGGQDATTAGPAILTAMLDHALAPTHAWKIHRMAAETTDPETRAIIAGFAGERVQAFSRTYLGTTDPRPIAVTAIRGYLSFAEAALDCGRAIGLPRIDLARLLDDVLVAALDAARA